jgi:5-methylcytosine-specific restriction endonuclease McrA
VSSGDLRYNRKAWRTLRRAVLERDGYACLIRGPRCTGYATTVDHIVPVAEGGEFWAPENLRSACGPCNYGLGARLRNRRSRQRTANLYALVEQQADEINRLVERVMELEQARQRPPQTPAIH